MLDWVTVRLRSEARLRPPAPLSPVVVMAMLPVLALVVARLASSVTAPPHTEMGPATDSP